MPGLPLELLITVAVMGVAVYLFITEKLRVDVVALLVMTALLVLGVLSVPEALSGFSNQATVMVACMFVLSGALKANGALVAIGDWSFRPAGALSPPPLRWLARALDRLRPPRPGDTLPPRLLSFPSLTYAHAGEARSVGFLEPLRLAPGSSTTRAARAARACGFLC